MYFGQRTTHSWQTKRSMWASKGNHPKNSSHSGQNTNWVRTDPLSITSAVACNACHLSLIVHIYDRFRSSRRLQYWLAIHLHAFAFTALDWWIRRQRTPQWSHWHWHCWCTLRCLTLKLKASTRSLPLPRTISHRNSSIHIDLHQFTHLHRARWRAHCGSLPYSVCLCSSQAHLPTAAALLSTSHTTSHCWLSDELQLLIRLN